MCKKYEVFCVKSIPLSSYHHDRVKTCILSTDASVHVYLTTTTQTSKTPNNTMDDLDFAFIVGSSAYLARQLELRWFFQWENNVLHGSKQSDAISSSEPQSLEQRTPIKQGRLVRRRYHTMPFLQRNLVAQGSGGRRSLRNIGSQTRMRKRTRPSLACYFDGMKALSDNTAAVALSNPEPHPKRAQPSLSTNQSNENNTRRCNGQGEPMLTNVSRTIPDASSALLLTVTCRGFAKSSAVLLLGASSARLESNIQLGSAINTAQSPTQLPRAYFHYLFMQPNNVPATIVEEIAGRTCPLCNFDGKNNEGLLVHCGTYHGTLQGKNQQHDKFCDERTNNNIDCAYFEAALGEEGQLHVIVRGIPSRSTHLPSTNCIYDKFAYIQPRFCTSQNHSRSSIEQQLRIPFLGRRHDKVASLDSVTRSKRLLALQSSDAPASVISAYLPSDTVPIRQYFHSHTNLPMTNDDWMEDSDDDIDENWVQEMSSELLDEFEDVAAEEKQFLTLWNKFIKSNHVIGDRDIPDKCSAFVLTYRNKLIDAGLRLQLLLHLFHLWDSGVISSNRIRQCMSLFDGTTV